MRNGFALSGITIDYGEVLVVVAGFWSALLDAELRESLPGWRRLGPLSDGGPVLTSQPVPDPEQAKARLHLDLQVDDPEDAVALVEHLGGRVLDRHDDEEGAVVVMTDVDDNGSSPRERLATVAPASSARPAAEADGVIAKTCGSACHATC